MDQVCADLATDNMDDEEKSQQDATYPEEPELRNVFERSPDIYDKPIDTTLNMKRSKRERSITPDVRREQPFSSRERTKTEEQDAGAFQTNLQPPVAGAEGVGGIEGVAGVEDNLALRYAKFEGRRKAVIGCHDAVRAMAQATNALVKQTITQIHDVTKHESIPLFDMLPKPNSDSFAIMAVLIKPGFDLEKARWHYEILCSVGGLLESALERLTQTQFHVKEEMDKAAALRMNEAHTTKGLAALEKRDAQVFKDLLRRTDNVVSILDRLSEKIGKDRFEVDEKLLCQFDAANKQAKIQTVNKAWKAAKDGWGKPGFKDTKQGKDSRMLRVLRKYEVIEPILGAWNRMLKARTELKDCCTA